MALCDPDERSERIVRCRGKAMLGREPVVDVHDAGARRHRECLADRVELVEASEDEAPAVVVADGAERVRHRLVDPCRDRTGRTGNLDVLHGGDLGPGADQVDEEAGPRSRLVGCHRGQRRRTGRGDEVQELLRLGVQRHRASWATIAAATSGVPYVWKLSTVFTPQNWPRARSSADHVTTSKSGS